MFSMIGLSLDVVGAVALAVGLFGHSFPTTFGGYVRRPDDVAHDTAFGLVGAPLLIAGFAFQALYYLDIRWQEPVRDRVWAALVTLGSATLVAYLAYGFLYIWRLSVEQAYADKALDDGRYWKPPSPRFRRLRWWLRHAGQNPPEADPEDAGT